MPRLSVERWRVARSGLAQDDGAVRTSAALGVNGALNPPWVQAVRRAQSGDSRPADEDARLHSAPMRASMARISVSKKESTVPGSATALKCP